MNSYALAGVLFLIGGFITLFTVLLLNIINNKRTQKTKKKRILTMISEMLDQSFMSVRTAIIAIAAIQTKANILVLPEAFTFTETL